jgi:hypothetical protein
VLEKHGRVLGIEHPDTVMAAANLAATYWAQGRRSEAEKLELEVLEQRKRALGMEHPNTTRAAANLAVTYRAQCRWSETEKPQLEVLEQRRRVPGIEHPDTIKAAVKLSLTYGQQGRWEENASLLAPAVQLSFGEQHPHTQGFLCNLASVYEVLVQTKEAQETRDLLIS